MRLLDGVLLAGLSVDTSKDAAVGTAPQLTHLHVLVELGVELLWLLLLLLLLLGLVLLGATKIGFLRSFSHFVLLFILCWFVVCTQKMKNINFNILLFQMH